jgi:hypothetical protein
MCIPAQGDAANAHTVPTIETIASKMTQARIKNQSRLRAHVVKRDYALFGKDRQKPRYSAVVEISFAPPNVKAYRISTSNGGGIGAMVIRRVLDGEVAAVRETKLTEITPDNYELRFVREDEMDGRNCYVLDLIPKRKAKNLLGGNIWVDADTYLPRRVEGGFAQNPSWWVRNVHVVLLYGEAEGMWLQTASEATANVRILGQSTMISRDLKYQLTELTPDESASR